MNVGIRNLRQKCQNNVILFRAEVISEAAPAVPRIWNPEMFMARDNGQVSYPIGVYGWKDPLVIRILKVFCNSVIVSRCRPGERRYLYEWNVTNTKKTRPSRRALHLIRDLVILCCLNRAECIQELPHAWHASPAVRSDRAPSVVSRPHTADDLRPVRSPNIVTPNCSR